MKLNTDVGRTSGLRAIAPVALLVFIAAVFALLESASWLLYALLAVVFCAAAYAVWWLVAATVRAWRDTPR